MSQETPLPAGPEVPPTDDTAPEAIVSGDPPTDTADSPTEPEPTPSSVDEPSPAVESAPAVEPDQPIAGAAQPVDTDAPSPASTPLLNELPASTPDQVAQPSVPEAPTQTPPAWPTAPYPAAQTPAYPPAMQGQPYGYGPNGQPGMPAATPPAYPTTPPVAGQPPYGGAPAYGTAPSTQPYGGYTPQWQQTPPAKAGGGKKTWLYVVIGVVVVALIAVGLIFGLRSGGGGNSQSSTGPTSTAVTPAVPPEDSVKGYLQALANGDAATALSYAATKPTDTTFLTDEVLAASNALNPISSISVTPYTGDDISKATISASYNIGDDSVNTTFDVVLQDDKYLLKQVTQDVDLTLVYSIGLGMSLNGVSLDDASPWSVTLFPGVYQVATSNPYLKIDPDMFTVEDVDGFTSPTGEPVLADDAQAKLAAVAKSALSGCLKEKKLATSCGFGFAGLNTGRTPKLSTLTWKITSGSNDFSKVTFQQYNDYSTEVYGTINLKIQGNLKDTKGSSYRGTITLKQVTIDFSDPDHPDVQFGS